MLRILICFLTMALYGCASSIRTSFEPNENHLEIIKDHPLKKGDAFDRAIAWMAVNYNSVNTVMQLKERDQGLIVVKALQPFQMLGITIRNARYTMQIKIKDEKSKFIFDITGLAADENAPEQPGFAPPKNSMPEVIAGLTDLSNRIAKEWSLPTKDDF